MPENQQWPRQNSEKLSLSKFWSQQRTPIHVFATRQRRCFSRFLRRTCVKQGFHDV
ncbi:Hypothetical protein FKW44_020675 [Caligus rogercresseyi]|uniref:Uncharacterized protein n=1 Tax=Caligus rogercresseyi TaxID=217165 RepID=A0A7T8GQP4_CALRO|nr:Hypothetical protein FKW44_020675 [Caligus rogercresseyi]